MKTIRRWGSEPLIVPRWMLLVTYAMFVALGIILAFAGSPSIAEATSRAYLVPYGAGIAVSAAAALVAVALDREPVEMVAALLLWCLLLVYVGAVSGRAFSGDLGTQAISVVVVIASLPPMGRGFSILPRAIRSWTERRRLRA